MKKVSILLLTIDRYNMTRMYVGNALRDAGYPFELCISDNGSTDPEIFKWCEEQSPKVYFKNGYNYGTAQSLNRMIEANPSDYYVFIGNDIELPKNWLKKMVEHAEAIPEHGVIGIDWRGLEHQYPRKTFNGVEVMSTTNVFGDMFISQSLRDKIGVFNEGYGVYGIWDADYSIRATCAGRENFYLCNETSHHFGNDVGEDSAYRKMKDESLSIAATKLGANKEQYLIGNYYIPKYEHAL